jgi:mono/diheme cytochrome c family protein
VVATDGANLSVTYCAGCHGPVTATTIKDGMPDKIKAAVAGNMGGMGALSTLTADQINTIAQQLPCH